MPNNFFPALDAHGALPAMYQYQQNSRQNQLVDIQQQQANLEQQRQQNALMRQQQEDARRQQFNSLIPQLAGLSPMAAQAAQPAIDASAQGAPPQQSPVQQQPNENELLARAYQLDPEGTQQFLQIRQQRVAAAQAQKQAQAAESVREAQFVLASKSPKALLKAYFPDRVEQITQAGHDFESMSDDDVRNAAQHILERAAPSAGLDPTKLAGEGFTLGEGQKRFDARGNVIAQVAKGPAEETAADRDRPFQHANTLRDEFNKQSTTYQTVTQAYQNIKTAADKPSAAGDLSLIFGYMKILDPGSTVREGEFANAQSAGSVPARIRAQYNKVLNGERLAPEQRKDFLDQAGSLYQGQRKLNTKLRDKYSKLATRAKIDPADVIGDEITAGDDAPAGAGPKRISSDADYNSLPSGAEFIAPDGSHRKKP